MLCCHLASPVTEAASTVTLILSNSDVEKLLTMHDCIDVMEEAYIELAEGRGISRTRSDCFAPTTRPDALYSLKSMDGVAPKLGAGAVRINSDIITWPKRGNNMRREKVPAAPNNRYVGLVLLFSVEHGEPVAMLTGGVLARPRDHPLLQPQPAEPRGLRAGDARLARRRGRAGRPARGGDRRCRHCDVRHQFHRQH